MRAQPRRLRGQAATEYALLLGVITAAILGIHFYAKRGIQAGVKFAADSLAPGGAANAEQAQLEGMRYESGDRANKALAEGTVLERRSAMRTTSNKGMQHQIGAGGSTTRTLLQDRTNSVGVLDDQGTSSSSAVIIDIQ